MASQIASHVGPWTEQDLLAMPHDGQRHELVEGCLVVSPPPAGGHQAVATLLQVILFHAQPPHVLTVQTLGVRIPGGEPTDLVPDLLAADREAVLGAGSGILDPGHVQLVVEIVSPSSETRDRTEKPLLYARAGIPCFWRLELEGGPAIEAFRLQEDAYVREVQAHPGERFWVQRPFPVEFDPAQLRA